MNTQRVKLLLFCYLNLSTVLTALLTLCKRLSAGASSSDERTELIGRIRDTKVTIRDIESCIQLILTHQHSLSLDDGSMPFITTAVSDL